MEIAFTEVPPEERTALPVREQGVHLPSFTLARGADDAEGTEGEVKFSYFPRAKESAEPSKRPSIEIPQSWPDVDEDTMQDIIHRLGEL